MNVPKQKRLVVMVGFVVLVVGGGAWLAAPSITNGAMKDTLDRSHAGIPDALRQDLDVGASTPEISRTQLREGFPHRRTETHRAADVFNDADIPLGRKFAELAARADAGDKSARHLAYQVALQCNNDLAGVSAIELGVDQFRMRTMLRDACESVLDEAAFATYADRKQPRGAYNRDVPFTIKTAFAEGGAEAALAVALSAIKARPDAWNIRMVGDTLESLGVSTIYTQSMVSGNMAQLVPSKRKALMAGALLLVACDYGMPCGPNSHRVRYICAISGVCREGVDLMQIYRLEVFSGQEMRNVLTLLEMLRSIPPADVNWSGS